MLIARDQLNKVTRQVARSEQPVIITDASRKILLVNETMQQLLPAGHAHLGWLEDLPKLFSNPEDFRNNLTDLCDRQMPWRGKVELNNEKGRIKLLLRADPVIVPPQRVLGYVLVFTDLTEMQSVQTARRRFQQGVLAEKLVLAATMDPATGALQSRLFTSIIGNAQLAVMELGDGADVTRIPQRLDSVAASVSRASELLKHLLRHQPGDGEAE
jgi:signal transduction histidine kinase